MKVESMKVEYVDHMGSDAAICDAARVSFDKLADNYTPEQNEKLLSYLVKHSHWSPLAHTAVKLRVKAPIFVARQLVKHQIGLVWNEVSRRYVDSEPSFYFPEVWRGRPVNAKQGSSGDHPASESWGNAAGMHLSSIVVIYEAMIADGVAPEQARMILPQNMMTEWIWTGSLVAFARVCKLRLDPHAQAETSEVARGIADTIAPLFPVAWKELMNADH